MLRVYKRESYTINDWMIPGKLALLVGITVGNIDLTCPIRVTELDAKFLRRNNRPVEDCSFVEAPPRVIRVHRCHCPFRRYRSRSISCLALLHGSYLPKPSNKRHISQSLNIPFFRPISWQSAL